MPFPNEHACRLRNPNNFVTGTLRSKEVKKGERVIFGKLKSGASAVQTIRYDKSIISEASARSSCESHHGSFEPAKKTK